MELKNKGASGWVKNYDVVYNADNIVFSDIMTMRDSITLLAQYDCINDYPPDSTNYDNSHQIFLLDRFLHRGCRATHISGYCNIALYNMPIVEDYYYHLDVAPMRLFHINDLNNDFGVAFGVKEENGMHGGIRLFKFHNAWEYYSSLYYRSGVNAEVKEVGNQYKSDTLYVLSNSSSYPNGRIDLISMGAGPNPVTMMMHYTYTFNSLTQKFAGNHIDISGHGGSDVFHLFDQYIYATSSPSCFPRFDRQYEALSGMRATSQYLNWTFTSEIGFEWRTAEVHKIEKETDIICEKCN